jgi:tetratricopeptide (TPR) repeat protein
LAWVLYKAGDYREAQKFSQQALRLGTKDALKLFHAGMIHYRLGDHTQARRHLELALAINPHFSLLYAGEAQRTLDELATASSDN